MHLLTVSLRRDPAYAVSLVDRPIAADKWIQWHDRICLKEVLLEPTRRCIFMPGSEAEANSLFKERLPLL